MSRCEFGMHSPVTSGEGTFDPGQVVSQGYHDAADASGSSADASPLQRIPKDDDVSLRTEALDRLRWNVLASPSTVEVIDLNEASELNEANELCWSLLLADPKHPLAEDPVTSPPTSRIHIMLAMIDHWECLGMIDESPPPLLIHNTDRRAITVEQFVTEVSAYAKSLRELIDEIEDVSSAAEKESRCLYYDSADGLESLDSGGMEDVFPLHFMSSRSYSAEEFRREWMKRERLFKEHMSCHPTNGIHIAPGSIDFAEASRNFRLFPEEVPREEEGLLHTSALDRLRWNLLAPPSTVLIIDSNEEGEPSWRPMLVDPKHPLADEAVTEVPRSRMCVAFDMVEAWECWERYDDNPPPPPLLIENSDGNAITIEQFIVKVSRYAQRLRETIFECEGRALSGSEGACLWFDAAFGPKRKDAEDPDILFLVGFTSNFWFSSSQIEADHVQKEKRFVDRSR
ncbi:uncharacterized protein J4E87_010378 [Alternaria ethzedia]|uniref:uncharacterized protein n=1 Tax=Alternaria ethzedia TaxID=181014 RepID=UPI0020C3AD45|nr:uncharacterized protein J4E87_010378 [Alternaria ethzedia]KAI4611876.1 hypothetical protein J4E87_010378 [Alternaria ethzedia]